ncbi:hypothetical protein WN944_002871 [Citrus x changshan-huyou]|uniref:RlpA-like protein double-psi beta-barrel domain-containing protein n=1 Tax=Citrus x changshan-huyou TaxID=2935761 RepID=A0AAP0MJE9_9ROSI
MTGAAGDALWNNGAVLGKMLRHKCTEARNAVPHPWTSNNVNVKIVDHCSGCPSTIGLSREAFTQIANPVSGIINIDYHGLPPPSNAHVVASAATTNLQTPAREKDLRRVQADKASLPVKEAHTCNVVSKAEDHSSSSTPLQ